MPQTKEQRYKAKLLAKGYVRRNYILPPCVAAMVAADIVRYMAEYNLTHKPKE